MVKYTGRGLVVKRPGVLSKVQPLNLVLGAGVFSLLPICAEIPGDSPNFAKFGKKLLHEQIGQPAATQHSSSLPMWVEWHPPRESAFAALIVGAGRRQKSSSWHLRWLGEATFSDPRDSRESLNHSFRIYPYPMVWPLPRPWSRSPSEHRKP